MDDALCLYTLHGHSAAVSALTLHEVSTLSPLCSFTGIYAITGVPVSGCLSVHGIQNHSGTPNLGIPGIHWTPKNE